MAANGGSADPQPGLAFHHIPCYAYLDSGGRALSLDAPDPSASTAPPGDGCAALHIDDMMVQAGHASAFLKALAHEGRLMILCHLQSGEKSVTELETLLASRQAAVSQQLARLRLEGLVSSRRDGKTMFYSIQDPKVASAIAMVYDMFCKPVRP